MAAQLPELTGRNAVRCAAPHCMWPCACSDELGRFADHLPEPINATKERPCICMCCFATLHCIIAPAAMSMPRSVRRKNKLIPSPSPALCGAHCSPLGYLAHSPGGDVYDHWLPAAAPSPTAGSLALLPRTTTGLALSPPRKRTHPKRGPTCPVPAGQGAGPSTLSTHRRPHPASQPSERTES